MRLSRYTDIDASMHAIYQVKQSCQPQEVHKWRTVRSSLVFVAHKKIPEVLELEKEASGKKELNNFIMAGSELGFS